MIENAVKMLIVFVVIIFNIDADDADKFMYCVVDIDSPGIILNSTRGKDMGYNPSEYLNSTTLLPINLTNYVSWEKMSSNDNPRIEQMVLDQRWESLKDIDYRTLKDLIQNDKDFFVSVKIRNQAGHPLSWQQLRVKSINAIYHHLPTKNNMTFESIRKKKLLEDMEDPESLWKVQEYFYWHTTTATTIEIYSNKKNCTNLKPQPRCIHLTVAMCEKCEITIELKREERVLANRTFKSQSEGKWGRLQLCANNLTDCFGISLTPKNLEGGFWALDDVVQLTSCQKNYRYLKWSLVREPNVTGCENSYNKNITNTFSDDDFDSKTKCIKYEPFKTEPEQTGANFNFYILITLVPITIITVAFVFFFSYRKKSNNTVEIVIINSELENSDEIPLLNCNLVPDESYPPKSIERRNFVEYVRKTLDQTQTDNFLDNEFKRLSTGNKSYNEGLTDDNKMKNKFMKIIPYDDSRVKLEKKVGFTSFTTDYINASYVEGFNGKREYIVAQNPLPNTATDFWYMIWQENIRFIVMLSSRDDKDLLKYWPVEGGKKIFDIIEVTLNEEIFYEYTIYRKLKVQAYSETRFINLYHYDSWANTSEYYFSHTLVPFVQTLLEIPRGDSAPVLIHCSAGIGRVGTLILIDTAIRSSLEGTINMFQIAERLRNCRMHLVLNSNQYKLAHLVVCEYLNFRYLAIPLNDFCENEVRKQAETEAIRHNWEYIETLRWIDNSLTPFIEHGKQYTTKNRYSDVLPFAHSRVVLENSSPDYINATLVDGYRKKSKFITTQQPLSKTLYDFWLMVIQNEVSTIVNLNDLKDASANSMYCEYFPTDVGTIIMPQSGFLVKLLSLEKKAHYDKIGVIVSVKDTKKNVTVIHVTSWVEVSTNPDSADVLHDVWGAMQSNESEGYKTVICCDDGVNASGLLVCYSYLIDKLIQERRFDVMAAVRAVRDSHYNYITFDQFFFLFKSGLSLIKNHVPSRNMDTM